MIQTTIREALPSIANRPMHWAKRRRVFRHFHELGFWEAIKYKEDILRAKPPYTIRLIRAGPRKLDFDNLVYAFKPVRDGIAEALWPDKSLPTRDDHADVIWEYGQIKDRLRHIVIEVYDGDRSQKLR